MRIAQLSGAVSRAGGGVGLACLSLSSGLAYRGHTVVVQSIRDKFAEDDLKPWPQVNVCLHQASVPKKFGYSPRLLPTLHDFGPQVVHLHGLWLAQSLAALALSRGGLPSVISPHGMLDPWAMSQSAHLKRLAWLLFERENVARSSCIHALSPAERDAIRATGVKTPIAIVPNGVEVPDLSSPPEVPEWGGRVPRGAKVLLFFGRIRAQKGISELIEAFHSASSRSGDAWHLVIAGWGDQATIDAMHRRIDVLGLSGRVHFIGPQYGAQKEATFRAAQAFILPSKSEGLPLAVLEAWSFGLPVLMSSACNLSVGFEAGAAMRIEVDVAQLAAGLSEFFSVDEKSRQSMGAAGRRLVSQEFSWGSSVERLEAVYRWLLGDGTRPEFVAL